MIVSPPKHIGTPQPLTAKEKRVMDFLQDFFVRESTAPSFQEIREHFGFASLNSVQRYLRQLHKKGYIHLPGGNQKRALRLLHHSPFPRPQKLSSSLSDSTSVGALSLPLLGRVAAGRPIEALEHNEFIEIPKDYISHPETSFALKVEGHSMIEDGIFDGDTIFIQKQSIARNGETVVAIVDNEATVKKFYLHENTTKLIHRYPQIPPHLSRAPALVELRPANQQMESMWFEPHQVEIQGTVTGLLRKFSL